MIEPNTIHHADVFDLCAQLDAGSVDMILADLPYGTTACSWDTVIPFEPMWAAFRRIIKPRGAIVLTASQPFTSALVMSWPRGFKYQWYWLKPRPTGFSHAENMPLKDVEDVLAFSHGAIGHANLVPNRMNFYPQGLQSFGKLTRRTSKGFSGTMERASQSNVYITEFTNYPRMTLRFNGETGLHPTQKPVALFAYLIRTYTQPGELVFDPTAGSGTTAVAARQTGRHYIVGDSSAEYVAVMRERLAKPYTLPMLELEAQS